MTTSRVGATILVLAILVGACSSADDPTVQVTSEAVTTEATTEAPTTEAAAATADPAPASDPVDPEPVDPPADPAGGRVEYVDAEQGGENVVLEGTIGTEPDVFIVPIPACCTGETFGVTVTSAEDAVVAEIVDPSGETFVSDQTDTDLEPDETGDWTVILTGPPDSAYVLEIGLGVNAS